MSAETLRPKFCAIHACVHRREGDSTHLQTTHIDASMMYLQVGKYARTGRCIFAAPLQMHAYAIRLDARMMHLKMIRNIRTLMGVS